MCDSGASGGADLEDNRLSSCRHRTTDIGPRRSTEPRSKGVKLLGRSSSRLALTCANTAKFRVHLQVKRGQPTRRRPRTHCAGRLRGNHRNRKVVKSASVNVVALLVRAADVGDREEVTDSDHQGGWFLRAWLTAGRAAPAGEGRSARFAVVCPRSWRAASTSATLSSSPWADPGGTGVRFEPNWIEHAEPGG